MKTLLAWCRLFFLCRVLDTHDDGPVSSPRTLAHVVCNEIDGTRSERLMWATQHACSCRRCGRMGYRRTTFDKVREGVDVRAPQPSASSRERWN